MTPRRAGTAGVLSAAVPLWLASYAFGAAFPQSGGGLWPFVLGAAYGLCVLAAGGLCAYLVRLRDLRAAVQGPGAAEGGACFALRRR